jgi:O-antigen/teichoic acid export membrane protein
MQGQASGSSTGAMDFARNMSSTAATQVLRTFLGLGLQILLARWLSEADRGIYAVLATLALFANQLSQLGMRYAVIYRMSLPEVVRARAVGAAFTWTLAAFLLLCALALVFLGPLRERLLLGAPSALVLCALVIGGADLFSDLSDAVARGIDRFDLRNADQIAIMLVTLGATGLSLVLWQSGLWGALFATAVARVGLLAVFLALTLRLTGVAAAPEPGELRASFAYGIKSHSQTVLGKLHERLDVMMMAALQLDPAQIAVYAIAVSVVDRLRVVPDSVSSALLPKLATLPDAEKGPYAARVTRQLMFWVALSCVALLVAAPVLLPVLFGKPYAASVLPLYVLLPATAMLTLRWMIGSYFLAVGRPGFNARVQAVSVAVNFAVNLWAIPRFGILGAAGASLVSYGVEAVLTLLVFRRATRCGWGEIVLARRSDLQPVLGWLRRGGA